MYYGLNTLRLEVKLEVDNVNLPLGNLNDKSLDLDEVIAVKVIDIAQSRIEIK